MSFAVFLPPLLYVLTFWAVVVRLSGPFRVPRALLYHYLGFLGTFYLTCYLHPWCAYLPLLALGLWIRFPSTLTPRPIPRPLWGLFGLSLLLVPLLTVVPLAETDSVGYMIPMAEGGRLWETAGTWLTDSVRAIRRLWGLASHASIFLHWSSGAIHGLSAVLIPGFITLLHGVYVFARYLRLRKRTAQLAVWLIGSLPPVVLSLFSLKDDILFAAFGLSMLLLALRPWRQSAWHELGLWVALITSKLFYPLFGLLYLGLRLTPWRPARLARTALLGAVAVGLVLGLNYQRVTYYRQELPIDSVQFWALGLTGATDQEIRMPIANRIPDALSKLSADFNAKNPRPSNGGHLLFWWRQLTSQINPANVWWYQPIFYPNYTCLLLATLLVFIGASHWRQPLVWGCVLYYLGFFWLFRDPNAGNLRYIFLPVVLLILQGLRTRLGHQILYACLGVQAVWLGAFLCSEPILQPLAYYVNHPRAPYAVEVASLNYNLPPKAAPATVITYPVLVVSTYQTTPVYLFTDGSHGSVIETTLQGDGLERMLAAVHPNTVLAGLDFVNESRGALNATAAVMLANRLSPLGWEPTSVVQDRFLFFGRKKKP